MLPFEDAAENSAIGAPGSASSKIDRCAPPARDGAGGGAPLSMARESAVAALFAKVLNVDSPGEDESFFDLGGNSLSGLQLLHEIDDAFGCKLSLGALLQSPTIRQLALRLNE